MPLVEGESLRDRLTKTGALPIDEATRIFREVADALATRMHAAWCIATSSRRTSFSRVVTPS
jgi:hypothetical protein